MWQDTTNQYGGSSSHSPYYDQAPQQGVPLQFYAPGPDQGQFYPGSRSSLEGNMGPRGSIGQAGTAPAFGGNIQQQPGGWWTAFGTGGFEGEPPLLEGKQFTRSYLVDYRIMYATELGINFSHIRAKSMTVLNPLRRVDDRIMDDADLAGPLLFFFCFGVLLLLVSLLLWHIIDASHLASIVREASVWIHIWLWIAWLHLDIHIIKPHVRKWHRCIPRSICARLLLIANGRRWCNQRGRYSRVRHPVLYSQSATSPVPTPL